MVFDGKGAAAGVAIGRAYVYGCTEVTVEKRLVPEAETGAERARFERGLATADEELCRLEARFAAGEPEKADILAAHRALLCDVAVTEEIVRLIQSERNNALMATDATFAAYIEMFEAMDDPMFAARAVDLKDVRHRLLRSILGLPEASLGAIPENTVICARELFPGDTMQMNRRNVAGIVTERGNETSHTAILARAMGIPAVLGVEGLLDAVSDGDEAIVDAEAGRAVIRPTAQELALYCEKRVACEKRATLERAFLPAPACTKDGTRIYTSLNIGSEENVLHAQYADGVGLFRTEFLFLRAHSAPDEMQQYRTYRTVLERFSGRPVILRTLDVGADKQLPYLRLPAEDNPFLGRRGIRFTLAEEALFKTQLRAALRASAYGQLWIMFPMVTRLEEFRRARALAELCRKELAAEGAPVAADVRYGIMIEVPVIALIADRVAAEVDFASIGANDLCQYATASDRLNAGVTDSYEELHPGLLRLIRGVIDAFESVGKPVCICGEMGGRPASAALLVGMGMRRLSMSAPCLAGVKRMIAAFSLAELKTLADDCLTLGTADEVRERLNTALGARVGESLCC